MSDNDVLLKDYAATPLSFNPRTIDRGSGIRENVNSLAKVDGTRINPATTEDIGLAGSSPPTLATGATGVVGWLRKIVDVLSATLNVILPADQDPIFDHANGVKLAVTANATLITPPTGCKYIRISSDVDCFINTANGVAADDAQSIRILANSPEVIPVVAGVAVKAFAASSASIRATPMKVR